MRTFKIFISSPSDLRRAPDLPDDELKAQHPGEPKDKRALVAEIIDNFNKRPGYRDKYKFQYYAYEELTPALTAGDDAQRVVDKQMIKPRDTDIVICMLWSRMGTPLADINPYTGRPYASGTEYEFYDAYDSARKRRGRPLLLLYRYLAPPPPLPPDATPEQIGERAVQIERVKDFFERFEGPRATLKGLYKTVRSPQDLEKQITTDIEIIVANEERKARNPIYRLTSNPLALALIALLFVLVGVMVLLLRPQVPPLKVQPFNVAIAGFVLDEAAGITRDEAQILSESFFNSFEARAADASGDLPFPIGVWSPAQVGIVQGKTPEEREKNAQALVRRIYDQHRARADIVVYGAIVRQNDRVGILPEFLITESLPELSETFGRFSLNAALTAPSPDQMRLLTGDLTRRSEVLSYIVQGIVSMVLQQYDLARQSYDQALNANRTSRSVGNELIYILRANASLGEYNRISALGDAADMPRLPELLKAAEDDFTQAVNAKPDYARSYAGLGSVLYLRALEPVSARAAWSEIANESLQRIEDTFQKALQATDNPETADIPTKANFGIGQVYTLRFLRGDANAWDEADKRFDGVIADYGDGKNPRVQELAAQAHGFKGLLRRERSDFAAAKTEYGLARDLTQLDARKEVFRRSLALVTITERRAARDIDGAVAATDELLASSRLPPNDAAALLYQKGKMLSEAGRTEESVAAYEAVTKLNPPADAQTTAQVWAELGDKYYALGRLQDSIDAYQKALDLDPQRQGHLARIIEETKAELQAQSATPTPEP